MRLHVLTAVTRPLNLPDMAASLTLAWNFARELELCWHLLADPEEEHVGGQALKNRMLDQISDGWCWLFDDDNMCHPLMLRRLLELAEPGVQAVVVSQERSAEEGGRVLEARPENVRVGQIDAAQAVISRELIGAARLPEVYDGDGWFLEEVLRPAQPGAVVYCAEVLAYHNALREEAGQHVGS